MAGEAQELSGTPRPARARERRHPSPVKYVAVATVLCVLTVIEVGIYYVQGLRGALVPLFLILSAAKFSLVALFYMHLKFDSRLFSWLFLGGLVLAGSLGVALLFLFRVFGA